jgi:hypothetical protein
MIEVAIFPSCSILVHGHDMKDAKCNGNGDLLILLILHAVKVLMRKNTDTSIYLEIKRISNSFRELSF